jgi:hypothetical protein
MHNPDPDKEAIGANVAHDRMILGKEEDSRRIIMTYTGAKAVADYYYKKYGAKIVPIENARELEKYIQDARGFCKDLT